MTEDRDDNRDRNDTAATPAGGDAGHAWRDERKLPLTELDRAMATYSFDGQVDDPTGGDAGEEETFGDGYRAEDADVRARTRADRGDPPPDTEAGRSLAPSPDGPTSVGRTGPN